MKWQHEDTGYITESQDSPGPRWHEIPDVCIWAKDIFNEENAWDSQCGQEILFHVGTPHDNAFKFCPYCGKALVIDPERH